MTMPALLNLSSVSVAFGGLVAVSEVSLRIRQGEILGIIGPNGAGKSTLFNAISGLISLSSGSITYQSIDITRKSPSRRAAMGLQRTFQSVQLVKSLSVLENILLGLHCDISRNPLRRAGGDAVAHAREIAGTLGLGPIADQVMDKLSFREQRLTEIARAIASGPQLLLLDEPAAGLSEAEVADLNVLIRRLRDQLGISVMLVEHVMPLVMGLCDRVAVLETGRLLATGTPAEVAADERVIAAYLGATHA
jgi:branched-chain amino acid transport system ATP-binding protein